MDKVLRLTAAPGGIGAGFGALYPFGASDATLVWQFQRPDATTHTFATLEDAQTFTGALTLTAAAPQLTLGVDTTTAGRIKLFGSTSGNATITTPAAAGAGITITLPATSVTLNAAGDLTGTTLNSGVVTTSITTVGALNSGSITSGFGAIDVGADAITGGAGSFTVNTDAPSGVTIQNQSTGTSATSSIKLVNSNAGSISYIGKQSTLRTTYVNMVANSLSFYTDNAAGMSFLVDAAGPITFATNSALAMTIASGGAVTIPGTLGVTGAITGASYSGGAISGTTVTASTNLGIAATTKIYLDGVAMTGNTYISETAADIMSFVAGNATSLQIRDGCIALIDGITAPAAVLGFAHIFVDTSDGDLKVRFGDGTTKVLAADT